MDSEENLQNTKNLPIYRRSSLHRFAVDLKNLEDLTDSCPFKFRKLMNKKAGGKRDGLSPALCMESALLTETKLLDDCTIALDVLLLEVREETTTLTYELHQ